MRHAKTPPHPRSHAPQPRAGKPSARHRLSRTIRENTPSYSRINLKIYCQKTPALYTASNGVVVKIAPAGTLSLLANFGSATAIAADAIGNVYVAEKRPALVRKIGPDGTVTTVAGRGEDRRTDGIKATEADVGRADLQSAVDTAGHVYVATSFGVRKINTAAGTISPLWGPLAVDGAGRVYVGRSYDGLANEIRRIEPDGSAWVIAGTGRAGFSGDGDRAAAAELSVSAMAVDRFGTVWFADPFNRRIRAFDPAQAGN